MGAAAGNRALVADDAAGEAAQGRRQGRVPRSLHHGGGRHPKTFVRRDPAPDRRAGAETPFLLRLLATTGCHMGNLG